MPATAWPVTPWPSPPSPGPRPRAAARLAGLEGWCDPAWLPFVGCLLAPAALALALGDGPKARFFAGLALYGGVLKWLGWLLLGRGGGRPAAAHGFPAHLLGGLAVTVIYFYARNLLGGLWPASYSLAELILPACVLPVLHLWRALAVGRPETPRPSWHDWVRERLPAGAFALTLGVALWPVAGELAGASTDTVHHGFVARVYLHDGLFLERFNGGGPILYASGFGAVNATAAALAPLTVVQSNLFQHAFWQVALLFLVVSAVPRVAGRPAWLLAPAAFLVVVPVHNLLPYVNGEACGRQLGLALGCASGLLPWCVPVGMPARLVLVAGATGALAALVLAINPACGPFLVAAAGAAGVRLVGAWRRQRFSRRAGVVSLAAAGLPGLLVFACDPYYRTLALRPDRAVIFGSSFRADGPAPSCRRIGFSARKAWQASAGLSPAGFTNQALAAGRGPRLLLLGALAGCPLVGLLLARQGRKRALLVGVGWPALWLTVRYGGTFLAAGLAGASLHHTSLEAHYLGQYLFFLLERAEPLLLFGGLVLVGWALTTRLGPIALPLPGLHRAAAWGSGLALAAVVLVGTVDSPALGGVALRNTARNGRVTPEDLELVRWVDEHLPPGRGLVALACEPFVGHHTKQLYPCDGAQALALYGRRYNFCFIQWDPGRGYGYDDYEQHIRQRFDAGWCLGQNVRYLYASAETVERQPGLREALAAGRLRPVRAAGRSAVYEIVSEHVAGGDEP